MTFSIHWIDHLLILIFGLFLPIFGAIQTRGRLRSIEEWDTFLKIAVYRGNSLYLWVIGLAPVVLWLLMGRDWSVLGLRWPSGGSWGLSIGITAIFLVAYAMDTWIKLARPQARERTIGHWRRNMPFLPENNTELRHFIPLAFSAGIGEELFFRGYYIPYLLSMLGAGFNGQVLALAIPTAVFAFAHYYQGWEAMFKILILGLAFGILFLVSGSLLLPVLLHIFVDLASSWIAVRVLQQHESERPEADLSE